MNSLNVEKRGAKNRKEHRDKKRKGNGEKENERIIQHLE